MEAFMKGIYKNYHANDQKMKNALLELMTEKNGLSNISVCDLVKRAGINRGTFYNHYESLEEVVESLEDQLTDEVASEWTDCLDFGHADYPSFVDALTNQMKKNEALYSKIVPSIPAYVFKDLKEKLTGIIYKDKDFENDPAIKGNLAIRIVSNGAVALYLDYFMGHKEFSLDQIAEATKFAYTAASK